MVQWRLSIPRPANKISLAIWYQELQKQNVPREIICFCLLSNNEKRLSIDEMEAISEFEHDLSFAMLDRNLKGIEFEKIGKIDDAISLYEANLSDWFSGNHPYDRLRVIYTKDNKIAEAIRVCTAFIRVANELIRLGSPRSDLLPKRDKFAEWADKLRNRL